MVLYVKPKVNLRNYNHPSITILEGQARREVESFQAETSAVRGTDVFCGSTGTMALSL